MSVINGNGMCGYNGYYGLLTFNLFLDFSIAGGRSTVVLSSKLTLLSSNIVAVMGEGN